MFGRTDLEMLKEMPREKLIDKATDNFVKELTRLASTYPEMKFISVRYLNGIISMDIVKDVADGERTYCFTKDIHQFTLEEAQSLYARIKVAVKKYKVKTEFKTDK